MQWEGYLLAGLPWRWRQDDGKSSRGCSLMGNEETLQDEDDKDIQVSRCPGVEVKEEIIIRSNRFWGLDSLGVVWRFVGG